MWFNITQYCKRYDIEWGKTEIKRYTQKHRPELWDVYGEDLRQNLPIVTAPNCINKRVQVTS